MNCLQAQQEISDTGHLDRSPELQPTVAAHVATCADCQKFLDSCRKIDAIARDLPPKQSAAPSDEFLQKLAALHHSQNQIDCQAHSSMSRRNRFRLLPRQLATAAAVLIFAFVAFSFLMTQQSSAQGAVVFNELVEWNLQISQQRSITDRLKVFRDHLDQFRSKVAKLRAADQTLAQQFLSNAESLATEVNPLEDAEKFATVADQLLNYRDSQREQASIQKINSIAGTLVNQGIVAKLKNIDEATLSAADVTRLRSVTAAANRFSAVIQGTQPAQATPPESVAPPQQLNLMPANHVSTVASASPQPSQQADSSPPRQPSWIGALPFRARLAAAVEEYAPNAPVPLRHPERIANAAPPVIEIALGNRTLNLVTNKTGASGSHPMLPPFEDHGPPPPPPENMERGFMPGPWKNPGARNDVRMFIEAARTNNHMDALIALIRENPQLAEALKDYCENPDLLEKGGSKPLELVPVPPIDWNLTGNVDPSTIIDMLDANSELLASIQQEATPAYSTRLVNTAPEPSTILLVGTGCVLMMTRKRKRM